MRILTWTGAALAAAGICALSACGGGGGHAAPLPSATSTAAANNPTVSGTSRVTLTIHRAAASVAGAARTPIFPAPPAAVAASPHLLAARRATQARFTARLANHTAAASRKPKLFSPYAQGLIISIAATGTAIAPSVVYADISASSPLCTSSGGNVSTCTLTIPNIATSETITAQETDETPTGENTATGYGTGTIDVSILGAVVTTATITPNSQTPIAMTMSPVASQILDADNTINIPFDPTTNFAIGENSGGNRHLLYISSGATFSDLGMLVLFRDADTFDFTGVAGTPFVDVNGVPTMPSAASATPGLSLAVEPNPGAGLSTTQSYASAVQFSDTVEQTYNELGDINAVLDVAYDGTPFTSGSLTISNNLAAPAPSYSYGSQAASETFTVVGVGTDVTTATTSIGQTTVVTGLDYQGTAGMISFNEYTDKHDCTDDNDDVVASVSAGTMNTATWQQPFTVTGVMAGTCKLYLVDANAYVEAQPVTITVTAGI